MIGTLLIANRGEIACRVARSAHALGIRTVAVYSEADSRALHVSSCDAAMPIGPAPASASYLNSTAIIEAAHRSGADAIHPGYGFLSENADFAEACARAGVTFVGPPADAIRKMGSKAHARELMQRAGIALVPGYHGADQDRGSLEAAAAAIGYPVLIKASAGGGGRGMRIVAAPEDLAAAIESARREAEAAFGDDRLLIEKFLARPRHVEVQVFADSHGNAVHLFERDCSIQRRHQKVLEEAPAPGLGPDRRAELCETAVQAARAVGYVGAGTVEFVLDADGFYFIEMNTRLQVEHPVTEMITGIDLVAWQLQVAAGAELPLSQDRITATGHAFEARLCAEDPRDFQPRTGRISHLRLPGGGARVDTGVREGDSVSVHYDALIAKLVVHGPDRESARARLSRALTETRAAGLITNQPFLARLADHPAFSAADIHTGFIEAHADTLFPPATGVTPPVLGLAALVVLREKMRRAALPAADDSDPVSPWRRYSGWRLNAPALYRVFLRADGTEHEIVLTPSGQGFAMTAPETGWLLTGGGDADDPVTVEGADTKLTAHAVISNSVVTLFHPDGPMVFEEYDPMDAAETGAETDGHLTAPMPGRIIQVHVKAGDRVTRGAPLVVLEAMKMEHTISAPADGTVARVRYQVGDLVEEGCDLLDFEPGD